MVKELKSTDEFVQEITNQKAMHSLTFGLYGVSPAV